MRARSLGSASAATGTLRQAPDICFLYAQDKQRPAVRKARRLGQHLRHTEQRVPGVESTAALSPPERRFTMDKRLRWTVRRSELDDQYDTAERRRHARR
jgi:hypothetical protein